MKDNRLTRVNEEVLKEISSIIRGDIKDPRLTVMVSVVKVSVTNDLSVAKVYVSVLGSDEEKRQALDGLKSASGFIRRELAHRVNLRNTPELKFLLDDSAEYAIKMDKLIEIANSKEE